MRELLIELGLSSDETIERFSDRVRDRDDIPVSRCRRSGVIFLDRTDHVSSAFYEDRDHLEYWEGGQRRSGLNSTLTDDSRRARMVEPIIRNRRWLDIGTGLGGVIELSRGLPASVVAVEPQTGARNSLKGVGYDVHASIDEIPDASVDVATMFHVYEHIAEPIVFLSDVRKKIVPGGRICIEVPHARNVLLARYECAAFQDFTLWSEHIILHTRQSLSRFIEAAGFIQCRIQGVQRYALANHLHWLSKKAPGGHDLWHDLVSAPLDREYETVLASLDLTDTLVAWADVPG